MVRELTGDRHVANTNSKIDLERKVLLFLLRGVRTADRHVPSSHLEPDLITQCVKLHIAFIL